MVSTLRTTREISCTHTWQAPVTCPSLPFTLVIILMASFSLMMSTACSTRDFMYIHFEIIVSRSCSDNEASFHTCVGIASHHSVVNLHSSTSCEVFQTFSSFRCDRQAWRCKHLKLFGVVPTSLAVQTLGTVRCGTDKLRSANT